MEVLQNQSPTALQVRMYRAAETGMLAGKIALCEGSTGTGKSRVQGWLAQMLALEGERTWICAPTLSILVHLIQETLLTGVKPEELGILLGRQNFVSKTRLIDIITDTREEHQDNETRLKEIEKVETWLNAGCPPIGPTAKFLAEIIPGFHGFAEDLLEINSTIAPRDCCLHETNEESTAQIYEELKERALTRPIVFCTHAMLARLVHQLTKETSLFSPSGVRLLEPEERNPFFDYLIIDEAHSFETAVANALGSELSLLNLRSFLKHRKGAEKAVRRCTQLMELLRDSKLVDGDTLSDNRSKDYLTPVRKFCQAIRKELKNARGEGKEWLEKINHVAQSKETWTHVSFSPIRRYPSILTGPKSVYRHLQKLWNATKGAALFSGTLYTYRKMSNNYSCEYIRGKLAIPPPRTHLTVPAVAPWIYSDALLMKPSKALAAKLCYQAPDEEDEENTAYQKWVQTVASVITNKIVPTAAGGILVLTNSHKDSLKITQELMIQNADNQDAFDLIRGPAFYSRKRFFEARAANRIPVWVATGAAWTGLDLTDKTKTAETDFTLTDVVEVRMPFGLNRTVTHKQRKVFLSFSAERDEAIIQSRQGRGRLIRRPGTKNRRLWILDGRIFTKKDSFYQAFTHEITKYPRQQEFDLCTPKSKSPLPTHSLTGALLVRG